MGRGRKDKDIDRRRSWTRWWPVVVVVVVVVVVAGAAIVFLNEGDESGAPASIAPVSAAAPVARRETQPTLDPARFVGKAAVTHQIAREIPDVLDQLYCYCQCDKSVGHKSLLSCYTDGHAAT